MAVSSHLLLVSFISLLLCTQIVSAALDVKPKDKSPKNPQEELRNVGLLILPNGKLEDYGYMKIPLKIFNENSLKAPELERLKKWDNFDVFSDDFYFGFNIYDLKHFGYIRAIFHDFKTGETSRYDKYLEKDQIPELSYTSYRYLADTIDNISYEDNDFVIKVHSVGTPSLAKSAMKRIFVSSAKNNWSIDLHLNITSDHEGISTATPLDKGNNHFYYNVKTRNIPVHGVLQVGSNKYFVDADTAVAGHTYGRGTWTDKAYILQAYGQGFLENGRAFSFIIDYGYGDAEASQATGDAFMVDKYTFKLNSVDVELDDSDLTRPIKFKTLFNDKKDFKECNVTFTPKKVEDPYSAAGEGTWMEGELIIGEFSGYVTDYKGKKYRFSGLKGVVDLTKMQKTTA